MFGWGRKKTRTPVAPVDAFDALIEDLEREATQVRRSAALLLVLRGELKGTLTQYEARQHSLDQRMDAALTQGDEAARAVLDRDQRQADRVVEATQVALSRTEADAALLSETAQALHRELDTLRHERHAARATLALSTASLEAFRHRAERFKRLLEVEAARDELERAHALALLYRERS